MSLTPSRKNSELAASGRPIFFTQPQRGRIPYDARSELTQLDEQEPEAIEQHRDEVRKSDA